jgi:ribosomal protein S18 acetylase RimI-like enzyme
MEPKIRPAELGDAPFIAWVELQAARSHLPRGFWDIWLQRPEKECLGFLEQLAQTPTRGWFHYSAFMVAEVDGHLASAMCGYDDKERGGQLSFTASREATRMSGWSDAEFQAIAERITPVLTCISEPAPGAWIIENVATRPEYRRRGLADKLLKTMLDIGRSKGYRVGQISVMIGNTPAQCAYEKAGFKVVDEKRHADFEKVVGEPGMRRMLREI